MGRSVIREGSGAEPFARLHAQTGGYSREKEDGCTAGTVCGTYVHGIFDADDLAWRLAESAAEKKGLRLTEGASLSRETFRERHGSVSTIFWRRQSGRIWIWKPCTECWRRASEAGAGCPAEKVMFVAGLWQNVLG